MTRKRTRGSGPPPRRQPPPDDTGLEQRFLQQLQRSGRRAIVATRDGGTLVGTISGFDTEVIHLSADHGPCVLRRSEIRYLRES